MACHAGRGHAERTFWVPVPDVHLLWWRIGARDVGLLQDDRRDEQDRRIKQILNYEGEDRREKNRRSGKEQRSRSSRREAIDRRLLKEDYQPDPVSLKTQDLPEKDSKQSLLVNNARLHLNGVTHAMTFVHTGHNITFMETDLGIEDFQIR